MDPNTPQSYDDIEIRIHSNARLSGSEDDETINETINQAGYYVMLRYADGEAKSERPPLPYAEFESLAHSSCDYGTRLFEWLFEGEVGEAFRQARWVAAGR